jgi:prolyl oligopeptidase PreP (S9A serine peptidase family)
MLRHAEYPAVLIRAGTRDDRCPPAGAMSFIARFREVAVTPKRVRPFADKNICLSLGDVGHQDFPSSEEKMRSACEALAFMDWAITEGNLEAHPVK